MVRFVLLRLQVAVLVAITVSIVSFTLLRASGDISVVLAGENASSQEVARIARDYGLDQPLYIQYLRWVGAALQGDLGRSLFTNETVFSLIVERLPVTLYLAVPALFIGLMMAVPLGVIAAVRQNTWVDRLALSIAVAGSALPSFWFALLLIYFFGVYLRWLPISGSDTWLHFVLPWLAVSVGIMPSLMRLTRTGMLEVMSADYVRTARAKGLTERIVMYKHALRNAILPVVSLTAVNLGFLLGGSLVIETVFALNGIGMLAYLSIRRFDFPVVQSIIVFVSFAYIGLTLIADVVNAKLDPRIGYK